MGTLFCFCLLELTPLKDVFESPSNAEVACPFSFLGENFWLKEEKKIKILIKKLIMDTLCPYGYFNNLWGETVICLHVC